MGDQLLALPLLRVLAEHGPVVYHGRGVGLRLIQRILPTLECHDLTRTESAELSRRDRRTAFVRQIYVGRPPFELAGDEPFILLGTTPLSREPMWQQWMGICGFTPPGPPEASRMADVPPRLVLAPGSGSPRKNWPLEQYAALARLLPENAGLTILMGPAEMERQLPECWRRLDGPGSLLAGEHSADTLIECLKPPAYFIGNDSGLAHLAGALRSSGLVIFQASDPALWAPVCSDIVCVGDAAGPPDFDTVAALLQKTWSN